MEPRIRVAVCVAEEGRLLLVAHGKGGRRYWLLPGGGVERGETLVEAARRELREETGLEVEVGRLVLVCEAIEPGGRHLVNLVFAARGTSPEPGPGPQPSAAGASVGTAPGGSTLRDPAIEEVRWVTREELLGLEMHPPIAAAVAAVWDAGFAGEVRVLGNVWVPDPGRWEGRARPRPGRGGTAADRAFAHPRRSATRAAHRGSLGFDPNQEAAPGALH